MRRLIAAATASLLCAGIVQACDDHHGACEIEDWRYVAKSGDKLMLEGVTTCDEGRIIFRLYDGDGDAAKFLGTDDTYIEGHVFKTYASDIPPPRTLSIKYSIEPQ